MTSTFFFIAGLALGLAYERATYIEPHPVRWQVWCGLGAFALVAGLASVFAGRHP